MYLTILIVLLVSTAWVLFFHSLRGQPIALKHLPVGYYIRLLPSADSHNFSHRYGKHVYLVNESGEIGTNRIFTVYTDLELPERFRLVKSELGWRYRVLADTTGGIYNEKEIAIVKI